MQREIMTTHHLLIALNSQRRHEWTLLLTNNHVKIKETRYNYHTLTYNFIKYTEICTYYINTEIHYV